MWVKEDLSAVYNVNRLANEGKSIKSEGRVQILAGSVYIYKAKYTVSVSSFIRCTIIAFLNAANNNEEPEA